MIVIVSPYIEYSFQVIQIFHCDPEERGVVSIGPIRHTCTTIRPPLIDESERYNYVKGTNWFKLLLSSIHGSNKKTNIPLPFARSYLLYNNLLFSIVSSSWFPLLLIIIILNYSKYKSDILIL